MKTKLLDYIVCPKCGESNFKLSIEKKEQGMILEGIIVCQRCGTDFVINKAIVRLFEKFSDAAEKEKKSHEQEIIRQGEKLDFQNDEWLLNFPDVSKMGIDDRSERIIRLTSENSVLRLEKNLKLNNNVILEIGAGNCWLTAKMAENNYCVALDILNLPPIGLEAGRVFIENRNIHFERVMADMVNLPFKPSVFDYVVISSSLHHSSDIKKTLCQIYKILKPNGIVALLNEPSVGLVGSEERKRTEADTKEGFNEDRYTINEWRKLFTAGNFSAKILLPENLLDVLRTRGGIYKKISFIFIFSPVKRIVENFFSGIVLRLFDGFFTAILVKKNYKL